ncbi:DUF3043 domain-containing protein [Phycicoccus sp. HDW14]|uniref:DUF3043 domain-containing protein n=1 Tax=Phycicoccus sp. HDW14 TaxID=2714941 RepID=UPI00140D4943|nr:DUF3043 domain-containing protein [Phycicoccus sp. HDW14]QIM20683.1 DUF3043 domain-containing protein [Phycicoccus sp. HDW14]
MFGRSKTTNEKLADEALAPSREGAKNRPTPKRRDQEAARRQPLVVADRKEAKQIERQKRREQLARTRKALETGDEAGLPPRDKGPVKRYIRDYVDARRNLGEFLLPIMLVVLALSLVRQQTIFTISVALTWASVLAVVIDSVLMWRGLKKRIVAKFGADAVPRGAVAYAVMRVFQLRRQRMPKPQVARGQYPS